MNPFDTPTSPQDRKAIKNLPVKISIEFESAIVLQMPSLIALANPRQADKTDEMKPRMKIISCDIIVCTIFIIALIKLLVSSSPGQFLVTIIPSFVLNLLNRH